MPAPARVSKRIPLDRLRPLFDGLFFLFLLLLVATRGWTGGLSHDEYQFVAAGQLLEKRLLLPYIHFPFLHMPYMAFLNGLAMRWTEYDLLAARGLTALCGALTGLLVYWFGLRTFDSLALPARAGVSSLFALLFVVHPLFIAADGHAINHAFPALAGLLALVLLLPGSSVRRPRLALFLSGLLAGLALGARLSYAALLPWLGIVIFASPVPIGRAGRWKSLGIFALGAAVALLPALLLFLAAPQQFLYGNLVYIRLNTLYRELTQFEEAMNWGEKSAYFFRSLLGAPANALIFVGGAAGFAAALARLKRFRDPRAFSTLAALGAAGVMLATSFAPTPLWPQYFFAPLPFLWVGLLLALALFQGRTGRLVWLAAGVLLAAALLGGCGPQMGRDLSALRRPAQWVPVRFHQDALRLRARVPQGKVLTLAPILPLEAGLDSYAVFAVGPFAWRTAPSLSPEKRREYRVLAYTDLEAFLEDQPPQAILVGFESRNTGFKRQDEGGLEKPFTQYAAGHGYHPLEFPAASVDVDVDLWIP